MADSNTVNTSEDNVNTQREKKSKYTRLIQDFAKFKLKDPSSRASFVSSLRNTGSIDADLLAEIQRFSGQSPEYDGLEITIDKLNYNALNRETTSYFVTLANNRQELRDIITGEYDVSPVILSKKGKSKIEELEEPELKALMDSEKERKRFLKEKVFKNSDMPESKALGAVLSAFDLKDIYKFIPEDEQADFIASAEKIQKGQSIDTTDLETILGSGIYAGEKQKEILQKMIPSMSLAEAKRLKLITDTEANSFKESIVKKHLTGGSGYVSDIVREIKDEDLIFSTDDILDVEEYRKKIIEDHKTLEPFVRKYGDFINKVNQDIDEKSIKKKSDFIEQLRVNPSISGIVEGVDKLKVGSIIQIEQTKADSEGKKRDITLYGKISEMTDDGKFVIVEKGSNGKYNSTLDEKSTQTYSDFLTFIQKGNNVGGVTPKAITFMSESELQEKIKNGEIEDESIDSIPLVESDELVEKVGDINKQIISAEKNIFKEEDKTREKLQLERRQNKNSYSNFEIEEQIQSNGHIKKLKRELEELKQKGKKEQENLDDFEGVNVRTLQEYIDKVDKKGAPMGFESGITFETEDDIYTITNIDPITKTVSITGIAGLESIQFQDFFQNFKKQKARRVSKTNNFDELIRSAGGEEDLGLWKDFVFKNGKIRKKGSNEKPTKSGIDYNYLVSNENDELVKIESVEGDRVTLSFGKLEQDARKAIGENGKEETVTDEKFSIFSNLRDKTFHVSYLESYIKRHKLEPRSLNEKNESRDVDNVKDLETKFHIFSFFFRNLSISEAIQGGTQFVEQIKEIMQEGQEEHALQFANTYLGKLLPKGGKQELQVRLENSQKKRMDDYLERLKNVASDVAIDMIDGYLTDRHGPEYPKEAAVIFMLEKYGTLNAKKLQAQVGNFVWYRSLGGSIKPPDSNYLEAEEEMKDEDLPLTEEYLVYTLFKKQCKPSGYNGVKRRSKLHKEVKRFRGQGKQDEREVGIRDAKDQRTLTGRVKGCMNELKSNNYPNAVGWLEEAVNKGGPMELMNKAPFVMAFSGIAYDFEESVTDDLKNFPAKTRLLMMLRFFSHHKDLNVLNNAIMRVCDILQEKGGKFSEKNIGSRARSIFNKRRSAIPVADKIEETEDFYADFGEDITNIMYMLNTGEKDDNLNKLIFFEKDEPGNEALKEYYNHLHGFIDADTEFGDEGLMKDPFKYAGTSGLDLHKVSEQLLVMRQGHWTKHDAGPLMWDEVQKEFEAIPHRQYDKDPVKNKQLQRKLLRKNLQDFLSGLLRATGANQREMLGYNSSTSPLSKLNIWGIDMTKLINLPGGVTVEGLHHGDAKYTGILDTFVDRIMSVETKEVDSFAGTIEGIEGEKKQDTINNSVNSIVDKENPAVSTRDKVEQRMGNIPNDNSIYGDEDNDNDL